MVDEHKSNNDQSAHQAIDSLVLSAKEELGLLVDRLREGKDLREHRLFSIVADVASNLEPHHTLWIERVFRPSPETYESDFLYDHSINVGILAMSFGVDLAIRGKDLLILGAGAILHDVGMFGLPRDIIQTKGPLTEQERQIVETHPVAGAQLLQDSGLNKIFSRLALQEQERQDGTGYPHKLKANDIEYFAKIIGFCDSIESITHFRPYRKPTSFLYGFSLLLKEGYDRFPGKFWMNALRRITPYPPGSLVRLSTGRVARVSKPNAETPMRPIVALLDPDDGHTVERLLDLRGHPMITIQEAIA